MEDLEVGASQESSVAPSAPEVKTQSEEVQSSGSDEKESVAQSKLYTEEEVTKKIEERLIRDRRIREKADRQYNAPQSPQGYAQPYQPTSQESQAQVPVDPEVYKTVATIAQQSYQQQRILEERYAKLNEFMQIRMEEESKDADFAEFSVDMEKRCPQGMLEAAVYLKDPTILYRIHKENPAEFNRISRLSPQEQYLKVAEYRGEYRGRSQVTPPKIVSSATPPMEAPKTTGSSYQKPLNEMSAHERLQRRRAERKKAMSAR